ncbi:hypothetical protein FQR65_LT05978 [Abscondita terminalis]|nr:hypothetical protein FQR65_LT05978 [Abscondita terminalis]
MDAEVKQRNRRRKRAQRMQQAAQRESKVAPKDGDSGEEDSECAVRREKPLRPPIRRKKSKEPLVEEDIIDGFSILGFRSYDDLESVIKLAGKDVKRFLDEKATRHESRPHITHHISVHPTPVHGLTITHQDPGTSDDSGRASERLTGSSVAPRDADSSRDRLSDASSRCSSGKGYICDSEGEDDKGSDASSVIFGAAPASRKHEFPGALPPSLPLSNGTSNSPVPAPTPPNLPAPSPAPAQQPPPHPISNHRTGTTTTGPVSTVVTTVPSGGGVTIPCSTTVPMTMPQPAAAPVAHHPPAFVSTTNHGRTESPAVATSANAAVAPSGNGAAGGQYHHPTFQPLYAPYAVHNTYSSQSPSPAVTATTTTVPSSQQPATTVVTTLPTIVSSHRDTIINRTASPKGHSPSRERESYSSNVSSLSRSSVTPLSCPPPTSVSSSLALSKNWSGASAQLSPAPPRPTPPLHSSFPSPMFATPLPPPATTASPLTPSVPPAPAPNPNPFSAESLFQSNQADMLRRELDNRFLASQDRTLNIGPPPYLRAEMHQHQHHHTHVHQHTTSILPPPPSASTLFPTPLFKDIPKLGSMDSPFYRQNIGLPGYPSYSSSLLHPGLTGPTPFVPPNHLPPFQPKVKPTPQPDPTKPKIVKSGKWNAMHVRIAWEVYHHQQKESKGSAVKPDLLRTPSHLFPPSVPFSRPHDLSFPPTLSSHRPPTFDQPHHPGIFGSTGPHLGNTISPFARYGAGGYTAGSSPFGPLVARDLPLGPLHDPWRGLQRTVPVFPPSVNPLPPTVTGLPPPAPWSLKPDPILEQREREERERAERERERLRREREERERREREEKQRKLEQQQQQERERERERREKERRELERRELERQQERERLLHQQRLAESTKQLAQPILRDRSPLRNGTLDPNDIRIKEEPRIKEEDRYHPYVRQHPGLQHGLPHMLDRSRVLPPPYPPPPTTHWPPSPADHYYRPYDPLRYNPLMDAMRVEEERAKLFGAYAHHPQFRPKDPGLLHLRANTGPGPPPPTHKLCPTPPTDLHKKEEPR